jgi:membrane associated rhomboid family serine protease
VSFQFDSFPGTSRTFPLREGQPPIVLEAEGFRHPRSSRRGSQVFTRFEDLTHLVASPRVLWVGARKSTYTIPRSSFAQYDAPERLMESLLARVGELPNGEEQLARMARVDEISRNPVAPRATWGLIGICLLVYLLQLSMGMRISMAGQFSPALVADGDIWRIFTANLLHAQPGFVGYSHITFNLLALLALGTLMERSLGSARTVCVMGAAAILSMLTSGWFGNLPVVGVSGVVFGLVGGILWLDYRRAEEIPAWWRFPRRSIWILLAINAVLGVLVPFIALAAHAGGLIAGAAATAAVTRQISTRPPRWVQLACGLVVLATAMSVSTAGMDAFADDDAVVRYATRWAHLPGISPYELNDRAWYIAISPSSGPRELEAALLLAERAVSETQRSEATILDTLAEVQFALGMTHAAIATIEEAIAHQPDDPYYREQLRRFAGERAPGDRPEYVPPAFREPGERPEPMDAEPDEPGLTV